MDLDTLLEPLQAVLGQIVAYLPRLAFAAVIIIVGWLIAKTARFAIVKALRAININVLTERAGLDGFLEQGGIQRDTVDIFGLLVYWLVVFAALLAAFNTLGMNYITELMRQVVTFVPRVMVALVILAFGAYFARFVAGAVMAYCRNVSIQDADLLGRIAQYAILAFVVLIALEQMQIAGDIIRISFIVILAGIVLALALAFGIGGQAWAAELLERWWSRKDRPPIDRP